MSAVITAAFGNPDAVRSAEIGNAAYERAEKLGYSRIAALQFSRMAKKLATAGETPNSIAMRVVRPKTITATGYRPDGDAA